MKSTIRPSQGPVRRVAAVLGIVLFTLSLVGIIPDQWHLPHSHNLGFWSFGPLPQSASGAVHGTVAESVPALRAEAHEDSFPFVFPVGEADETSGRG